jgi:hypothetical protein
MFGQYRELGDDSLFTFIEKSLLSTGFMLIFLMRSK